MVMGILFTCQIVMLMATARRRRETKKIIVVRSGVFPTKEPTTPSDVAVEGEEVVALTVVVVVVLPPATILGRRTEPLAPSQRNHVAPDATELRRRVHIQVSDIY